MEGTDTVIDCHCQLRLGAEVTAANDPGNNLGELCSPALRCHRRADHAIAQPSDTNVANEIGVGLQIVMEVNRSETTRGPDSDRERQLFRSIDADALENICSSSGASTVGHILMRASKLRLLTILMQARR